MKRGGKISFITYLLYLLFGGGLVVYVKIAAETMDQSDGSGIGLALFLMFGVSFAAYGLLGVLLKGIHMALGWGFFGFLCILLDLFAILAWISTVLPAGDFSSVYLPDLIYDLAPLVLPLSLSISSLVSNIRSLGR